MTELAPWLILFLPLISATAILFGLHRNEKLAIGVSLGAVWTAFAIAVSYMPAVLSEPNFLLERSITWMAPGDTVFTYGFMLDGLSAVMLMVVLGVGGLIHIYAAGYMKGDPGISRFFGCLSLFIFSMLGIVVADNLFQIFIHWELVGVSSYLLIGYYYRKPSASAASNKAFLTNRVGDFGFMIGILMVFYATGTATFTGMAEVVNQGAFLERTAFMVGGPDGWIVTNEVFMWVATALLLMGVMGKSAQFPLHVWLPDAMEGPTPVSALIHAATMVAAGVFLLTRLFFLYLPSETTMAIVAHMGMFTAFFAATIAMTQFDIKRILAFSTLSQLGYMVMAVGLGGPDVAMYHLTTHAFFKALLFLGAGSLIHSVHSNDIRDMGGMLKAMPITSWLFLIATAALCGFPGLSGFFSKDGILHLTAAPPAYADNIFIHWLPTITAVMTAYYMTRCCLMTFFGEPRYHGHPHEFPKLMWVPMAVLGVLSVIAVPSFLGIPVFSESLLGSLRTVTRPPDQAAFHHIHLDMHTALHSLMIIVIGAGAAFLAFGAKVIDPEGVKRALGPVHRFIDNRWYIDELFAWIIEHIQQNFARLCDGFDRVIIIGGIVNGTAWTTRAAGAVMARYQSGSVRTYALLFTAGVAALLALSL